MSTCPTYGLLFLLLLIAPAIHADPLFVQRVEAAQPTAEAIAKAEEKIRDHKDIKLREEPKVPPFHKRVDNPVKAGEAYCQGCHLPVPHSEKLRTRAFLNMHSRFIACETCHFRPEDAKLDYRWLDYTSKQPASPEDNRLRTGQKIDNAVTLDGRVKVAPFFQDAPAIAFPGTEFAERVARDWKAAEAIPAKAKLKAKIHAPLEKEGPACAKCHTDQDSMLDLAALGAKPEQVTMIQRHVIPQFFGRYKEEDERLKIIDILR
ncbi:multiheme c-type cytochrome [Methylomagnum sp.]